MFFGDAMVLQRDQAVPVWGTASPGERVVVSFAGQSLEAIADAEGKWRVDLAAMEASATGRVLQVGEHKLTDVLVGEVWLCSGQSNMWWPLRSTHAASEDLPNAKPPELEVVSNGWRKIPGCWRIEYGGA